ncbi:MAG TPA: four helix bundle protein [Dehalococcoidia bacterium]|nr:four helix bundle protein [Dehalococcoidia bacterium]
MRDFRSLNVWKKAHKLTLGVYQATRSFPREELYGLAGQLQRAVSSIPVNIAEGCGCQRNREFAYFLRVALRSASEAEYHLLLARDLGYLDNGTHDQLNDQVVEIKRMLTGLIEKLNTDEASSKA